MTNPRYCVFGDTGKWFPSLVCHQRVRDFANFKVLVNTCARHESTGRPGKVHLSAKTERALREHSGFEVKRRGFVDMKGKGKGMI